MMMKAEIATAMQCGDVLGAIFAALASGDIPAAAELASSNGYVQLASMITAGSGATDFIEVRQWYETVLQTKSLQL
jgi:hypothetical protein